MTITFKDSESMETTSTHQAKVGAPAGTCIAKPSHDDKHSTQPNFQDPIMIGKLRNQQLCVINIINFRKQT